MVHLIHIKWNVSDTESSRVDLYVGHQVTGVLIVFKVK